MDWRDTERARELFNMKAAECPYLDATQVWEIVWRLLMKEGFFGDTNG